MNITRSSYSPVPIKLTLKEFVKRIQCHGVRRRNKTDSTNFLNHQPIGQERKNRLSEGGTFEKGKVFLPFSPIGSSGGSGVLRRFKAYGWRKGRSIRGSVSCAFLHICAQFPHLFTGKAFGPFLLAQAVGDVSSARSGEKWSRVAAQTEERTFAQINLRTDKEN